MKKLFYTLLIALSANFANAQNKATWKELKDFHTVMSQTFHPAEEGNLKPIRERSAEMVKAAEAWKKSTIPADYKNVKDIQETLSKLVDGSKNLDKQVNAKASDAELKTSITALHDVFHTIVGLCRPGQDEHKGQGHDEHDGHKH
jgi:hypothetical protein